MTFVEVFKQCYLQMWKCKGVDAEINRAIDLREYVYFGFWNMIFLMVFFLPIPCARIAWAYLAGYPSVIVIIRLCQTLWGKNAVK